jgi:hypothetical protein
MATLSVCPEDTHTHTVTHTHTHTHTHKQTHTPAYPLFSSHGGQTCCLVQFSVATWKSGPAMELTVLAVAPLEHGALRSAVMGEGDCVSED